MALTLMSIASLPVKFWHFLFATVVFLINRLPSLQLENHSPYEVLFHKLPDYSLLKTFGCACFPLLKSYNSHKLEPKSSQCVFLDYPLDYKGYFCFNMSNNRSYTTSHVVFDESTFPFHKNPQTKSSSANFTQPDPSSIPLYLLFLDNVPSQPVETIGVIDASNTNYVSDIVNENVVIDSNVVAANTSIGVTDVSNGVGSNPTLNTYPMQTRSKSGISKKKIFLTNISIPEEEPSSFTKASKVKVWQQAINEEYAALMKQNTWCLTPLPSGKNVIVL